MKKLLTFLIVLLVPVIAVAETVYITLEDGLTLSHTINRDRVWIPESHAECLTQAYLIDKECEKAFALNQQLTDLGDVDALARLGAHFLTGVGVVQDASKGLELLRQAADAGVQRAQLDVVRCMLNGWGTEKNPAEAARLLEVMIVDCDAANAEGTYAENYTAQDCRLMLASLYRLGAEGLPANPEKADALFTEATAKIRENIDHWTEVCSDPYYASIYGHYLDSARSTYTDAESTYLSDELHPLLSAQPSPDLISMEQSYKRHYVWYAIGEAYEENTRYEDAARWYETVIADGSSTEAAFAYYKLAGFHTDGKLDYDVDQAISYYFESYWISESNEFEHIGNLFRDGVTGPDGTVYLTPNADIANAFYAHDEDYGNIESNILIADMFRDGGPVVPNAYLAARFYWAGYDSQYCMDELTKLYKAGLVTDSRLIYSFGIDLPYIGADVSELILLLADDLIHDRIITWQPGITDTDNDALARRLLESALDRGKVTDTQAANELLALLSGEE